MGYETPPSRGRKTVPEHGNLDHWYLKQKWTGQPSKRVSTNTFTAGTPAEYRETLRLAILAIDAIKQKDK